MSTNGQHPEDFEDDEFEEVPEEEIETTFKRDVIEIKITNPQPGRREALLAAMGQAGTAAPAQATRRRASPKTLDAAVNEAKGIWAEAIKAKDRGKLPTLSQIREQLEIGTDKANHVLDRLSELASAK